MEFEKEIQKLQDMIEESNNIVFFGGAGVSTESNIPDFRSSSGVFQEAHKYSPEQIVSHSFFLQNTKGFYEFYKSKMMFLEAQPNKAHMKLAELERCGKVKAVVTQNIDGLHQKAGSKNVLELHGSIHRNHCQRCHTFYDATYVKYAEGVPKCSACGGIIKPDVVLYEEGLNQEVMQNTIKAISRADMLIIGGTSLVVYPAAGFIDYFREKKLVVINKTMTSRDKEAKLCIKGPIGEILGEINTASWN
ncbi:MAG: NAD-dependent protein deacylase [Lachnospiraceae bacterium]|nr:NAD-dependent protein deacylase [Lachnospiraceae bacterium]